MMALAKSSNGHNQQVSSDSFSIVYSFPKIELSHEQ